VYDELLEKLLPISIIGVWWVLFNIDLLHASMNFTAARIQPRFDRFAFQTIASFLFLFIQSSILLLSMSSQKDNAIDEELFQFYLQFRLRQIQKNMLLWEDNSEKEVLVNILTNCQHVNGSE